eukprot:1147123-Pelagomonas_calceolata.AAC.2
MFAAVGVWVDCSRLPVKKEVLLGMQQSGLCSIHGNEEAYVITGVKDAVAAKLAPNPSRVGSCTVGHKLSGAKWGSGSPSVQKEREAPGPGTKVLDTHIRCGLRVISPACQACVYDQQCEPCTLGAGQEVHESKGRAVHSKLPGLCKSATLLGEEDSSGQLEPGEELAPVGSWSQRGRPIS